jgi:hypothetical protein
MSKIDLNPIHNNPDLPAYFKQHILKRIDEQNGQYGLAWRLIRRFREGRYCLAQKSGGRLCLYSAKVPGDGPRGRCGWHGGTGNSGPKTAEGKKRIRDAQRLRWMRYRNSITTNAEMMGSDGGSRLHRRNIRPFSCI